MTNDKVGYIDTKNLHGGYREMAEEINCEAIQVVFPVSESFICP